MILRSLTFAALPTLTALLLSGCGNDLGEPNIPDDPRLALPLQVYPNQTFVFDASGSTAADGLIRGYVFTPGDGNPALISRSPRLAYRYEQLGTFDVSLSLLDGVGAVQSSIEVVSCDTPLRCLESRPCPPGFVCQADGQCEPEFIACEAHSDCPDGLACIAGACGSGGPCVDPVDPPPPPEGCATHNDCASDEFCVEEECEPACDAFCEEQILASWELTTPPATGLALDHPEFVRDPSTTFYVMSADGLLWPHSLALIAPGDNPDAPPAFQGLLEPADGPVESPFIGLNAGSWHSVDYVDGSVFGEPSIAVLIATSYNDGTFYPTAPDALEAFATPVIPEPGLPPIDEVVSLERPLFVNSLDDVLTAYDPSTGEVLVGEELQREIASYVPEPGAVICGIVRDSDAIYLIENRVTDGTYTAARFVQLIPDGSAPTYFGMARPSCGADRGQGTGELYYVSSSLVDTQPFLIQQQIPRSAP